MATHRAPTTEAELAAYYARTGLTPPPGSEPRLATRRPQARRAMQALERTAQGTLEPHQLTLTLPYPPTVNRHLIPVQGRMVKSPQHRQYATEVSLVILSTQGSIQPLTGELSLIAELHPPDRRTRDADNGCKALLDALKYAGVYLDDSQVTELHPRMSTPAQPAYVLVTITQRSIA